MKHYAYTPAKSYNDEFKLRAIKEVKNGKTPKDVAEEMGCSITSVTNWEKAYDENNAVFDLVENEIISVKLQVKVRQEYINFIYKEITEHRQKIELMEKYIVEIEKEIDNMIIQ
jgi:transposase-like protein